MQIQTPILKLEMNNLLRFVIAGVKQPMHSFLGGKGLGILQGTSARVVSPQPYNMQIQTPILKLEMNDLYDSQLWTGWNDDVHFRAMPMAGIKLNGESLSKRIE